MHKANINSLDELENASEKLQQDSKNKMSSNVVRSFNCIDMFYDIYKFSNKAQTGNKIFSLNPFCIKIYRTF